ncbi:MAG: protein-disulfide reductase DsbD [Sulfurimonas sp.]|nr:protein-disulfide reductase DsbD [Sulfurimonas sp.]
MKYFILLTTLFYSLFANSDFLMSDEAFHASAKIEQNRLAVTIDLAEDIYLYKEKIKVSLRGDDFVLSEIVYPESMRHGDVEVYENSIVLMAEISKKVPNVKEIKVFVEYQGCSSKGLCYEPLSSLFTLKVDPTQLASATLKTQTKKNAPEVTKATETDTITDTFKSGNISLILLTFFGFGLLLALTPCVFPMIPILSSIIVSQGENMNAKKGFLLSLVYVLAMSVAYTMAGVLAGVFGSNIQASLQNPWVLSIFSAIFVILAISMFGFFEIGLPSSIQSRLSNTSSKAGDKGGYAGVAIMGFLSALIVGPCVAPPLAGALVYIGQTGDALLGGMALFVMSLGMGAPLLLIGIGAGKYMPRPGGWMSIVSKVFGVIMLAIAIWMISRIVSESVVMFLWAGLFIISSVYLGAFESLGDKRSWNALIKGLGLLLFMLGVSLFLGLVSGATNPMSPLEKFTSRNVTLSSATTTQANKFIKIHSIKELDTLLAQNRGKKIILDFYADWCVACKEFEHNTFSDEAVKSALGSYVLIQADVTANSAEEKALSKKYGVFGPPAIIFFDEESREIKSKKIVGYKSPEEFLKFL